MDSSWAVNANALINVHEITYGLLYIISPETKGRYTLGETITIAEINKTFVMTLMVLITKALAI